MTPVWRRARPLLGTLVEIGVVPTGSECDPEAAIDAAFAEVAQVQARMSRFVADSDVARFNAMPAGASCAVHESTAEVLRAAWQLEQGSCGLFNIAGGLTGGWSLQGLVLHKLMPGVQIDLGGIAKGHAVDRAIMALQARGCANAWVNAGGDLRACGDASVPVYLRDEAHGGTRPFAEISDGAVATSHFGEHSRSRTWQLVNAHVTVAAPLCLWADALTKVVALSGNAGHPVLAAYDAHAWLH
jgi:thiamine biosynthesis lipoprotein